jgi:hypothetical protein
MVDRCRVLIVTTNIGRRGRGHGGTGGGLGRRGRRHHEILLDGYVVMLLGD